MKTTITWKQIDPALAAAKARRICEIIARDLRNTRLQSVDSVALAELKLKRKALVATGDRIEECPPQYRGSQISRAIRRP